MVENTNHESGGTFADEDQVTEQCGNIKYVIIQSGDPSPTYDGQCFMDTDDDPLIWRVQDKTNTQWLTMMPIYYSSGADGYKPPSDDAHGGYKVQNGTLGINYDSTGTRNIIFFRANDKWYGLEDA